MMNDKEDNARWKFSRNNGNKNNKDSRVHHRYHDKSTESSEGDNVQRTNNGKHEK